MHNRVSIGVGIMVSDVGRVRVGGLVELMVWRSTWEEFVGEVRGSRCGLGYVVESMWFGICGWLWLWVWVWVWGRGWIEYLKYVRVFWGNGRA